MKKNSSHKTLSIVKRISITNIGIFIIACILSIVATLKLNVEYHIDRDAQMMKVYISNTLSSIDRYGKGFADRVFRSDGAGYSERY